MLTFSELYPRNNEYRLALSLDGLWRFHQEYQEEYLEKNHELIDRYDFIQGELVWNFADFQTSQGILRVGGNKKGIFTRNRQPKQAAYLFKKRWEEVCR